MSKQAVIKWLPYQECWQKDQSRFKIGMFARQTGKTYGTCGEIVADCLKAEEAGKRVRWVILSRGERQAKEAMNECIKPITEAYYVLYKAGIKAVYSETEYKVGEASYRALEVEFPHGSKITALPANPDTARGFSANVFLDEFAFHQNSREIWKALFPVISKPGLKLRITSTPNGKSNKFYDLWTTQESSWSKHRCDIYEAINQGLERDIDELRRGAGDEDLWRQEFELEFLDEAAAWLTYDLITACENEDAGKPELYQGGPCFIGNDIARRNDLWVAWVWEQVGDILWCREIRTLKNAPFSEHDAVLDALMKKYNVVRLAMDQTGMGEKPVEDAKRRYGSLTVEGVIMSGPRELTVATSARQLFEDRKVRIPMGDPVLRADLHKIQKVIGPTGAPRLVTNRDGEGHADRAWAAFLGAAAADGQSTMYEYTPVKALTEDIAGGEDLDGDDGSRLSFYKGAW
ncbi:MAG: terminase family protein [Deltaproteobacteria bacterium]|jgi:phage FluMu gp28-like protein|nr:terminase family protein [Deltaproteobacteria bacterium]